MIKIFTCIFVISIQQSILFGLGSWCTPVIYIFLSYRFWNNDLILFFNESTSGDWGRCQENQLPKHYQRIPTEKMKSQHIFLNFWRLKLLGKHLSGNEFQSLTTRGRNEFLYEDMWPEGIVSEWLWANSVPLEGQPRRRGGGMIALSSSEKWP